MHLNHFPHYFLFISEKISLPSWIWKNPCYVFDPISFVNENNDHFCTFIVKKCQFPCVSYACSTFKLKSFPLAITFSFNTFIWIIKKYHFPCDFDALFIIFLKIFVFPLICKYIFFHRDFKGKSNYKYGCIRQLETNFEKPSQIWFWNFWSAIWTLTPFLGLHDHPKSESCVLLGPIKLHGELDKKEISHLAGIILHYNFRFLKGNETKSQKFSFSRGKWDKIEKKGEIWRSGISS